MVSHRIVLKGSNGNTQTVQGAGRLDCSVAVCTSIVTQLKKLPSTIVNPAGLTTKVSGVALPATGLYGFWVELEDVIPDKATFQAGGEGEHGIANRIHVSLNQDSKTTFTQPDIVTQNMQFLPKYTVKFFYEDSPNTLLNADAMAGIHSVVLNFDCIVNNLIIS
jgi:hypothetical protein